ncbi:reverse transcriptase domain-containing protein [Tanacetum coccineum]
MTGPTETKNKNKFCEFHKDKGHNIDKCLHLWKQIEEAVRSGQFLHLIKEVKQGPNKGEHAKTAKKGEALNKEKVAPIFMTPPRNKKQNDSGYDPTSRVQRRNIIAVGQISLTVSLGDEKHSASTKMNFMVVRSPSPYNGIIGRPGLRKIQAVPSTAHGMLKFLVEGGTVTLHNSIVITAGYDMSPADMTGILRSIAEHHLNIRKGCPPIRQKKRGQTLDRNKAIQEEVSKLVEAQIMREVHYHSWLSNPVMGYHQIQMAEEDEEKTAFHKNQGVFYYTKMSFGLKNAGATYQWLVDKAFKKQIGRNLEVYADELVIKSHIEQEMLRDIEETFQTLRRINMKLNPKKCTFGAEEGMILGHIVNVKGIRACSDKAEAVIWLQSPRTLKEVQSLNGKLASLNRFLSKSAKKLLPFFKTLKNYMKKSNFQWMLEAEKVFQAMKQCITELPMVTAPKPREELIIYLCATREAISAVLLTDRESQQMPVYFVSRALHATEVNYSSMEKLVLALVHASRRLRRYFQAHPIAVITDQPIKQILSRPENIRRILKWKFKLEAFDITYRPRTSIRGQNKKADALSKIESTSFAHLTKQVLVEVLKEKSIEETEILVVVEEEGYSWMTQLLEYLTDGTLPAEAEYVVREIHEGSYSMHSCPRSMVAKALISGYYWPTMHKDARNIIQKCEDCQVHCLVPKNPQQKLTPITSPWPFYKWGIDISRSFPAAQGKVKFLIVAIDYFTKWIEAKPVATITGNQIKKFVWDNIVCKFRLLGEIISDNRKQFRDNPFKDWCEKLNVKQRFASVKHPQTNGQAAIQEAKSKAKMERYYNVRVSSIIFKHGDFMYRNNEASHAKEGGKLNPKWEGPYEVVEELSNGAYKIRNGSGDILPRT